LWASPLAGLFLSLTRVNLTHQADAFKVLFDAYKVFKDAKKGYIDDFG
jgi:hypothetical protein